MDRYNDISAPISKGSIIRIRIYYVQKGLSKQYLELNCQVLESPQNPSLGLLSTFVQEEIIKRFNRLISKEVVWTQIDIYIYSTDFKISTSIPSLAGRRSGSVQINPFVFQVIPEGTKTNRLSFVVKGVSNEFINFEFNQNLDKKDNKDINHQEILNEIEYMFLYSLPKEPKDTKDFKGLKVEFVVPVKPLPLKSNVEKTKRFKQDQTLNYYPLMAVFI